MGSLKGKYFWLNVWDWTKTISVILLVISLLCISGISLFIGLTMIITDLQETHPVLLSGMLFTVIGYIIFKETQIFMKLIQMYWQERFRLVKK
jgi:hypothetical protein